MTPSPWWSIPETLEPFAAAGVLERAEVHLAATLARLAGVETTGMSPDGADHPDLADGDAVVLAAALAARAPRFGHVGVDLATVASEIEADPDLAAGGAQALGWPDPDTWLDRVATCALVVPPDETVAPLVIHDGLLYLERHRTEERVVAAQILRRTALPLDTHVHPVASSGAARTLLTGPGSDQQLSAVESARGGGLTVLLGGPGTGKTTTVAALVAELIEQSGPDSSLLLALAAPTGKAAARLGEAFRDAASRLPENLAAQLVATEATTIHRLLGTMPGSRSQFRHHGRHPLPHDVVIVDESSMISLPLMARLLDAVRPDARVVIVGDPDQLASVEAGSVLGDIASAAADQVLAQGSSLPRRVTTLRHSRRFPAGSPIAHLADAVRRGDAEAALSVLVDHVDHVGSDHHADGSLCWIPEPVGSDAAAHVVRRDIVPATLEVVEAARSGDALAALAALGRVRVLCAHRIGPSGIEWWNRRLEAWSHAPVERWYPGRPVLVTANDHRNRLYNGDMGVLVEHEGRRSVAFADASDPTGVRYLGPSRLESVETTHAMTIHKSQGSEFDHVVVLLPAAQSRLATRELLYTAVTRARHRATVVGDPDAVAAAIERRTVRASRLRADLRESPNG
jgi:exodeoxyribonuclease V alpha subunit